MQSQDKWHTTQFNSLDEKLISFLDYLNEDKENQSTLINHFEDYYLSEKPMLPATQLKRLFYGYMKKDGLIKLLSEC